MPNYYDVLGCEKDATLLEMKKRYMEKAKELHPDKTNAETDEDFSLLDKAWKTLRDPVTRQEHDRELARADLTESPMYSEMELDEMTFDGCNYSWNCRCGGLYSLPASDIGDAEEILVGCDDCTFHIRIKVSANPKS